MKKKIGFIHRDTEVPGTHLVDTLKDYFNIDELKVSVSEWATPHIISEYKRLLSECDIVWADWCERHALILSLFDHTKAKKVIRLHAWELWSPWIEQIQWRNIDWVVFYNERLEHIFIDRLQGKDYENRKGDSVIKGKKISDYIPNTITLHGDLHEVPFSSKQLKITNKVGMCVAGYTKNKNLESAIDYFKNTNRLLIRIANGTEETSWFIEQYKDKVTFDIGKLSEGREPVNEFYKSIDVILSLSDYEASHDVIAEAMQFGVYPIVRNWKGAENYYGTYVTAEPFEKMEWFFSLSLEQQIEERKKAQRFSRRFLVDKYIVFIRKLLKNKIKIKKT